MIFEFMASRNSAMKSPTTLFSFLNKESIRRFKCHYMKTFILEDIILYIQTVDATNISKNPFIVRLKVFDEMLSYANQYIYMEM